jgi:hypothetical protein
MTLPAPPACLSKPYSANQNQKGGTLIAEDVLDRQDHRRRLADPDCYRPCSCMNCGGCRLHAHDFRERRLRGDPRSAVELVRRYQCVSCLAVWMVLPLFLARHLHRNWETVQSALVADGVLEGSGEESRVDVPATTRSRWRSRLCSSARLLTQVLAGIGAGIAEVLGRLSVDCSRLELLGELVRAGLLRAACRVAQLAGWIHRAVPGLRLM